MNDKGGPPIKLSLSDETGLKAIISSEGIVLEKNGQRLEYASVGEIDEQLAAWALGVEPKTILKLKFELKRLADTLKGVSILPEALHAIWPSLTLEEKIDALSTLGGGLAIDLIINKAIAKGWLEPGKGPEKLRVGERAQLIWEVIKESGFFEFVKTRRGEEFEVYLADGNRLMSIDGVIEMLCRVYAGHLATNTVIREVKGWALTQSKFIPPEKINPPQYLPLRNGILNLEHFELTRFADAYFTYTIPARVEGSFLKALRSGGVDEGWFEDNPLVRAIRRFYDEENWERLKDVLGSILAPFSMRLLAFIVGPENTGKSTLAEALRAALGPACASVPLRDIDRDPFALEPLLHARVNITVEKPDASLRNIELLKRLVGGDTLSINRKHRPRIELRHNVLKIISFMNDLPRFERLDSALLDRIIVIYTENPLSEEEKDPSIKEALVSERDRVLEFILWCAWKLREKGWRPRKQDKDELRELLERARFPLSAWIEECCIEDDMLREKREVLYSNYVAWAREGNVDRVLSRRAFYALMRTKYPEVKIGGEWYFKGIGLRRVREPEEEDLLGAFA